MSDKRPMTSQSVLTAIEICFDNSQEVNLFKVLQCLREGNLLSFKLKCLYHARLLRLREILSKYEGHIFDVKQRLNKRRWL